ncbi:MAG: hypothetical protein K9I94_04555 [Bacteroidales bacterium]|nr:hypothetical protein [Bacteroidales bacterium]
MKEVTIKDCLKKQYFWDIDISMLDPQKHYKLIIERIFSFGTISEMKVITRYYGRDKVIKELQNLNHLDPKTLNFVAFMFNVSKESFRCYQKMQSNKIN